MSKDQNEAVKHWRNSANVRMRRFYAALEDRLKRFQPIDYAPFVAEQLRKVRFGKEKIAQLPPHWLLHSVEANCAYVRGQNRDTVTWNRFAKAINVYHDFPDALQTATISESLDRFVLLMDRQQTELQRTYSMGYLARTWQLFAADDPFPSLSRPIRSLSLISCKPDDGYCTYQTKTITNTFRKLQPISGTLSVAFSGTIR